MSAPELPPPFVPLYGDERRKWADQMRAYGDARAAAAVLAERERIRARLLAMDDAVQGRHNYYAHAAVMLFGSNDAPKEQQP